VVLTAAGALLRIELVKVALAVWVARKPLSTTQTANASKRSHVVGCWFLDAEIGG